MDWKKLLSNKTFWAALIGVVGATLMALNYDQMTIDKVTAVISAYGALIAVIYASEAVQAAKAVKKMNNIK